MARIQVSQYKLILGDAAIPSGHSTRKTPTGSAPSAGACAIARRVWEEEAVANMSRLRESTERLIIV